MDKRWYFRFAHTILSILISFSLTHDQAIRPAPKEMLAHSWIVKAMKEDVHMAKWVRQVWKGKKIKERCVGGCVECDKVTKFGQQY